MSKFQIVFHTDPAEPIEIIQYLSCAKCVKEIPEGRSLADWAILNVGMHKKGIQVECSRHKVNVAILELRWKPEVPEVESDAVVVSEVGKSSSH